MRRFAIALLLSLISVPAQAIDAKTWGIYWMTPLKDCNQWGAPMISNYYASCAWNGVALSICPNMGAGGWQTPYTQNKMIQVKEARVTQILSDPTGQGYFVLGSGFAGDGADVFVEGSSTGGGSFKDDIPVGMSLYQGTHTPGSWDGAHFDLYAYCWGGRRAEAQQRGDANWKDIPPLQQQFIVKILYKEYVGY